MRDVERISDISPPGGLKMRGNGFDRSARALLLGVLQWLKREGKGAFSL